MKDKAKHGTPSHTNSVQNKAYRFTSEPEREVGVCIAIQKLGRASVLEIKDKIEEWNGSMTEKQISKCAESLRARDLLSIDLTEKNNGISIKRYLMKKIKLAIPEVAQIKDLVDDPSINPLKEELDRSKKTRKKGLKTFDYYKIEVAFDVEGDIQGFIPNDKELLMHYRDSNEGIIFHQYHFRNWLRNNLPLINRTSSSIGDIRFFNGVVKMNENKVKIIERYITNIESGFMSSRGTGGRGTRKSEALPSDSLVITQFGFPRDFINPEKIQKAFEVICENASAFGGNHKLSTGRLVNPKVQILSNSIWEED